MAFQTIRELPAIPAVEHNLEITSDDFLIISNAIEGGSTYKISVKQLNDVLPVFTPSTATTIGKKGLVPAPQVGDLDEYLTSSGDWDIIPLNTQTKSGIVLAPESATSVTQKNYSNALKSWSTDAEGKPDWRSWVDTIDVFTAPTATEDGKKGLVPAPGKGEGKEILRADGQWVLARDMVSSVTVSDTAPTDPVPKNGDLWFDTENESLFVYVETASSWVECFSAPDISLATQSDDGLMSSSDKLKLDNLGGSVTTSTSAPSGSDGDLWFNESTGELFVYVNTDGWFQANGVSSSGSSGGSSGLIDLDAKPCPGTGTGVVTWAHGQSSIQFDVELILRCTSAEGNYSVGDEVHTIRDYTYYLGSNTVSSDSTNVYFSYNVAQGSSPFLVLDKTTQAHFYPTPSKWEVFPRLITTGGSSGGGSVYSFSSSNITSENSYTYEYPTGWTGGTPDKVLVSTRYPSGDAISQVWFQVVSWDATHVTIYAQAQAVATFPAVIADILLVKNGSIGDSGGSSSTELRKFSEHNTQTIKINCSTSEALSYVGPSTYDAINRLSIVYAVGGSPRQHYTVMSFSGRTKKLRTTGGTYTLTSTNLGIGRENDSYGISARYDSGVLYIETSASSYTSSQFNGGTSDNNFMDTQFLVIDA